MPVKPRRSKLLSKHILPSLEIDEGELFSQLYGKEGSKLLLGKYTSGDINEALERESIIQYLRSRGIFPIEVSIDSSDPYHQRIRFHTKGEKIGEIILNIQSYIVAGDEVKRAGLREPLKALVVEWLVMELPSYVQVQHQHRFPGQRRPGLGVGSKVIKLLSNICRDFELDGVVAFPEFYHNAVLYSHYFSFLSPCTQGRFEAMMRDLSKYELREVSFAFAGGFVLERCESREELIEWKAEEMVYPVSDKVQNFLNSPLYRKMLEEYKNMYSYEVDWKAFKRNRDKIMREF